MTIHQLHKLTGQAIKQGRGRARVCINKPSFQHALEGDGCVILGVKTAEVDRVPLIDDDGGTALRLDGTERSFWALVLDGGSGPD